MATSYITIGNRRYADLSGGGAEEGPFVPAAYLIDPATGLPADAGGGGGGGDASAANQDEQTALLVTIDGDTSVLGAVAGAAVITDANGTVQQYLRGLVVRWLNALGAGTAAAALRVTFASDAPTIKADHATTGFGHGVTVVTTAGTDVALAGSTPAKWVTIQAQTDNTTRMAIGATGVDAVIATGNGISLAPGESITVPVDNLADVFIDALTNGDGVRYVYGT